MQKVKSLTGKQEQFCRNKALGMTNKEAYQNAYDTENMKESSIYVEANKLAVREDIQERIRTLQVPSEQRFQIEQSSARDRQIQFINERIKLCKQKDDEQSIIRYTEMLNKIYGIYKEADTGKDTSNSMENIDSETLKKLALIG